ncbi:MAG: hypothetical protein JW832_17950 [Deltaproteobacteria bacterium]|nr:hypothetical protein [Deltaproteobacteria bacterium]
MQITIEKEYIELTPERPDETAQLEALWRMIVDCARFNKKLVPIGEYIPSKRNMARFAIEGPPGGSSVQEVRVDRDCRCYCQQCNKFVVLKKGELIPPCCGKLMEILD